jgi:hypothetical protein
MTGPIAKPTAGTGTDGAVVSATPTVAATPTAASPATSTTATSEGEAAAASSPTAEAETAETPTAAAQAPDTVPAATPPAIDPEEQKRALQTWITRQILGNNRQGFISDRDLRRTKSKLLDRGYAPEQADAALQEFLNYYKGQGKGRYVRQPVNAKFEPGVADKPVSTVPPATPPALPTVNEDTAAPPPAEKPVERSSPGEDARPAYETRTTPGAYFYKQWPNERVFGNVDKGGRAISQDGRYLYVWWPTQKKWARTDLRASLSPPAQRAPERGDAGFEDIVQSIGNGGGFQITPELVNAVQAWIPGLTGGRS